MARKRMIDPSIWTDPEIIKMASSDVLFFIGLITYADDEGIFETDPGSLYFKMARTDISIQDIPGILERLGDACLIKLYGNRYGFLPKWFKHQNLKGRKAQYTKYIRPPKDILQQYPGYISEWEDTFKDKDAHGAYPWNTCFSPPEPTATTGESPVSHQCATSDSPVTPNTSEVNTSEVNRNIISMGGKTADGSDDPPPAPPRPPEAHTPPEDCEDPAPAKSEDPPSPPEPSHSEDPPAPPPSPKGKQKKSKKQKRQRFVKPNVEEVRDYARSIDFHTLDAQRFWDFYESKGWMVGKNRMKDWRAAVRTWASNQKQYPRGQPAFPSVGSRSTFRKPEGYEYSIDDIPSFTGTEGGST